MAINSYNVKLIFGGAPCHSQKKLRKEYMSLRLDIPVRQANPDRSLIEVLIDGETS